MLLRLFLLFTLIPLIELYLLLAIGRQVGFLATVLLVLLTGALGAWLARQQGLRTLAQVRRELAAGQLPAEGLLDGLLILIAGAVLLTPGLLTDVAGFALLVPASRRLIRRAVAARLRGFLATRTRVIVVEPQPGSGAGSEPAAEVRTVLGGGND